MPSRRFTGVLVSLIAVVSILAGCGNPTGTQSERPDPETLVTTAAQRLADVSAVRFELSVHGTIPGFPVRSATGIAAPPGRATGTIDIQQGDDHTEYRFVLRDGTVKLSTANGTTHSTHAPGTYSPGTLLSPRKGLGMLLRHASGMRTETTEQLHGNATYRIAGTVDESALAALVPGAWADATVKFWVSQNSTHRLRRVWIQLPPRRPNVGTVALTLTLSKPTESARSSLRRAPPPVTAPS